MRIRGAVRAVLVLMAVTAAGAVMPMAGAAPGAGAAGGAGGAGGAPAGGVAPAAAWAWPIPPPHVIARPYLAPPTPYGAGHRGIDIRAPAGSPVLAPDDGVVHFAGIVIDRPVVSIQHPDGVVSSFEPVTSALRAGDVIHRGDAIGTLEDGHCDTSPCLHLGARIDGRYVNPLVFLGGVPHAVLYPTRPIARATPPARGAARAVGAGRRADGGRPTERPSDGERPNERPNERPMASDRTSGRPAGRATKRPTATALRRADGRSRMQT